MLGGAKQTASEILRWLKYQTEKHTQRGLKKAALASRGASAT
jgi:hypothetical protein